MRIEMLKTAAGPEFAHVAGLVYEVPQDRANALIKAEAARTTKRKVSPQPSKDT